MKKINYMKALLVIVLFAIATANSHATTLRCGNKLVSEGDTTSTVKLTCGQPFDIEALGYIKIKNSLVKVDRYTYVFGKGSLVKILEFHGGNLVSITDGPRM